MIDDFLFFLHKEHIDLMNETERHRLAEKNPLDTDVTVARHDAQLGRMYKELERSKKRIAYYMNTNYEKR